VTTPHTNHSRLKPDFDWMEDRAICTLVFVLNGASFAATGPSHLTANAAVVLQQSGNRVVQLSNGPIHSASAYNSLARSIVKRAHGQAIGLVGFSAGGALALHIATTPGLKVEAVLDYYGVPDVRLYLQRHSSDHNYRPISGLAPFRDSTVSLLSGPISTSAHIVAAFGQFDPNVRADTSSADLLEDNASAHVYVYPGAHGVSITASRAALDDFLSHLGKWPSFHGGGIVHRRLHPRARFC
jgi:dienelactone hydrolase